MQLQRRLFCGMMAVVLLTALIIPSAFADTETRLVRPRIGIFEFFNPTEYQDRLLGKRASAAVLNQLSEVDAVRLAAFADVLEACEDMEIEPPFAAGYQQAVGHRVGAELLLTGVVERCAVHPNSGAVSVDIRITIIDQITGQPLLSLVATAKGRKQEMAPVATDVLVDEAVVRAARKIGETFENTPLIQTRVRNVAEDKIVLDTTGVSVPPEVRILIYRGTGVDTENPKLVGVAITAKSDGETTTAQLLGSANQIYRDDIAVVIEPTLKSDTNR
ncbi:MAG: hypothetical protein ACLFWB_03320 [Armatimonadota bacterium]